MTTIDITMMGKGGVGKTTVSAFFSQHKLTKKQKIIAIDIDPVNASFASFKALNVLAFNIVDEEQATIAPRKFDDLMEILLNAKEDVVIDSGASTFLPLLSYLLESGAITVLKDAGKEGAEAAAEVQRLETALGEREEKLKAVEDRSKDLEAALRAANVEIQVQSKQVGEGEALLKRHEKMLLEVGELRGRLAAATEAKKN